MSKVHFSNNVDQLLLPIDHSYTDGVKIAKVVNLRQTCLGKMSGESPSTKMSARKAAVNTKGSITNTNCHKISNFSCEICGRKSANRNIYRNHMKLHATPDNDLFARNELEFALYGKSFAKKQKKLYTNKLLRSRKGTIKRHLNLTVRLFLKVLLAKNE